MSLFQVYIGELNITGMEDIVGGRGLRVSTQKLHKPCTGGRWHLLWPMYEAYSLICL